MHMGTLHGSKWLCEVCNKAALTGQSDSDVVYHIVDQAQSFSNDTSVCLESILAGGAFSFLIRTTATCSQCLFRPGSRASVQSDLVMVNLDTVTPGPQ